MRKKKHLPCNWAKCKQRRTCEERCRLSATAHTFWFVDLEPWVANEDEEDKEDDQGAYIPAHECNNLVCNL